MKTKMTIFYDVSENQTYFSFGREISYYLGIPFFQEEIYDHYHHVEQGIGK
jgi:hypothetical protein